VADVHKFSEQVIDLAERLADIADAASGKGVRKRGATRWVVLPAVGAGLYALATSGSLSRQAKGVVNQAKARASDLPDDLLGLVRQQSPRTAPSRGTPSQRSGSGSKRRRTTGSAARKARSTR
jgi:hypothetical protein